jgi:putative transposase
MARLPRLAIADLPHHIIQRGNNRQAIFQDAADRERMLALLAEYAVRERVAIHGYVLMSNHFHLLATPQEAAGLSRMMQGLGRRYVQYYNRRYARTGTLWEGRYRATPIQAERYLLACMVYIDLNPVRAGISSRPEDYPWSSYAHYRGLRTDRVIVPHPLYWQLGNTPFEREARYGDLVGHGLSQELGKSLGEAAVKSWAMGDTEYLEAVQLQTPRPVSKRKSGRPRKPTSES